MSTRDLLGLLIVVTGIVCCICSFSSCTISYNTEYYKYKTDIDRVIAEKGGVIFRDRQ